MRVSAHVPSRRIARSHLLALAAAALVAVLAACGGPGGPAVPNATSLNPSVALRGASVTITGAGFGASPGSVTIGGVAATTTDWTDTSITATVPANAENAWQEVSVTTAGGSDTLSGLFVGVEYSGTGPDLQAFLDAREPGTAVLLQATNYDLTAQVEPVVIDNVDLYGRGAAQTTVTAPGTETVVLAGPGATTTLADLTLEFGQFMYFSGTFRDTVVPWTSSGSVSDAVQALGAGTLDLAQRMEAAVKAAVSAAMDTALQPAAADTPSLVFDGVTFTAAAPAVWGIPMASLPMVDLIIRDSSIDLPSGVAMLWAGGDVLIEGSAVSAQELVVLTAFGSVTMVDSDVESVDGIQLGAQTGLTVDGSTVTVSNGDLYTIGAIAYLVGGATVPTGGNIEFRGSTILALDDDLLDATDNGGIQMITAFAAIRLIDNVLIRTHDDFAMLATDSVVGEADITLSGNLDVQVGVFEAESAAGARLAGLLAGSATSSGGPFRNRVTFEGNTIATTESVQIAPTDEADVYLTGNSITAGDASPIGAIMVVTNGEGVIDMTGNDFAFTSQFTSVATALNEGTMIVTGNSFASVSDVSSSVTLQGIDGSCIVTDNVFVLDDPSNATVSGLLSVCGATLPGATMSFSGNDVSLTGASGSGPLIASNGVEVFTVSGNEFTGEDSFTLQSNATGAAFTGNTVTMGVNPLLALGSALTSFEVSDNTVSQRTPSQYGLAVSGMANATVTGNSFTGVGAPAAIATALVASTGTGPMTLTATGNTFTNYSRALSLFDQAVAAHGLTTAINDNVFDFTIDAAPKVATLTNVKDAIDATNNQWGSNTVLATVQGYVTLAGDTVGQGGSILLSPLKLP